MRMYGFWHWKRSWRLLPAGLLLTLGACPLSDAQLTQVYQSVLNTGLTTLVNQIIASLFATPAA